MSEQHPEPVPENSVTAVAPPKPPVHPLRGWLIALVIGVAVLIVSVIALGAVVWFSTSPSRANWGPERAVTVTVTTRGAVGTAQVAVGGQASSVSLDSGVNQVQTWHKIVPFGEGVKVVVALSQNYSDANSWDPTSSITCDISDATRSLSAASVDVVDNTAVCEWTNR
ncbi:MAG TPA: hypothetical protein DCM67_06515 [Propionibacteriaceae bacterium]|nr:hypothetical protein [Propionibacteriaceae bacterium]